MEQIINLNIEKNFKIGINFVLFLFIILTISTLVTLRYTSMKNNHNYIKYFDGVYSDFIKYILIELFIILIESMNTGHFVLSESLGRLAAVQAALLIFSAIKLKFKFK